MVNKFSFSVVLSLVALLAYTYITFMGLDYMQNGELLIPCLASAGFLIAVVICVMLMCLSKATRWRNLGTIGKRVIGLIALGLFLISAIPFTNFMNVVEEKGDIDQKIENVRNAADSIAYEYNRYAENRVESYKNQLVEISKDKKSDDYRNAISGAAGETDDEKIENLGNSLRRRLMPDNMNEINKERTAWLNSAKNSNILNIWLPKNIKSIESSVKTWTQEYKELSKVQYYGEEPTTEAFAYPEFDSKLKELIDRYTKFPTPGIKAILASLICWFIIMLPYILTEKSPAGGDDDGLDHE